MKQDKPITFRTATKEDRESIARLHARSWQLHYRGMLRASYLEKEVLSDRLAIWLKRFTVVDPKQYILIAEVDGQLCGFVSVYLNSDPQWGALIDNLHVEKEWQGRGLGRQLMQQSAKWVKQQQPHSTLYLWVLAQNKAAIVFYERMGGHFQEQLVDDLPGGGQGLLNRYIWTHLNQLINWEINETK